MMNGFPEAHLLAWLLLSLPVLHRCLGIPCANTVEDVNPQRNVELRSLGIEVEAPPLKTGTRAHTLHRGNEGVDKAQKRPSPGKTKGNANWMCSIIPEIIITISGGDRSRASITGS
jgi:hypothetical protein